MKGERHGMSHHPAPQRDRVAVWETCLGLAGGPLAWFVQLAAGYAIAAAPCYSGPDRDAGGQASLWVVALYLACLALALAGGLMSLIVYRRTRCETDHDEAMLLEGGHGRTRFLALWGMLLGFGFAGVILVNGIALVGVPACAL
jgi:hypothetical protein